jgi:ribonuclease P protein subunit POP4
LDGHLTAAAAAAAAAAASTQQLHLISMKRSANTIPPAGAAASARSNKKLNTTNNDCTNLLNVENVGSPSVPADYPLPLQVSSIHSFLTHPLYSTLLPELYPPAATHKTNQPAANKEYIRQLVSELLPSNPSGQANFNLKLKNKQLLLENPPQATQKPATEEKKSVNVKLKPMTRREKKQSGLFRITAKNTHLRYADFSFMNQLWQSYINDLLADPALTHYKPAEKLLKADYHGAILTVTQSKNPTFIGLSGLCIQETQQNFRLITSTNALKTVPKMNNIFQFELKLQGSETSSPDSDAAADDGRILKFELYGSQICYKSSERTVKKFKSKATIQLQ